jgi:hypothetical protein
MSLLKIPLEVFVNAKQNSLTNSSCSSFHKKAEELVSQYKCFSEPSVFPPGTNGHNGHSGQGRCAFQNRWKSRVVRREPVGLTHRPRIGGDTVAKDALVRREFMSLINKLTAANKEHIMKEIKRVHNSEYTYVYVAVLWDMMQRMIDLQYIYIVVFEVLGCTTSECDELWTSYVETKGWLPPKDCVQEQDYDEFCDFIKWKKRAVACVSAFSQLGTHKMLSNGASVLHDMTLHIIQDCEGVLEKYSSCSSDVQLANALMEQVCMLFKCAKSTRNDQVLAHIRQFAEQYKQKSQSISPMVRFKILDLYDLFCKK